MEEALRGTPGVEVMRSKTVSALSSVVLIFKRGTDIMRARQLVEERFIRRRPAFLSASGPR